ncbi:MAG: tetratricopeptide repeat protein [Rhodanobacteraceae bacterium]|nr:MAG: tetratricopeptide repeat protein [Rhodanobacteraceae bacterium]
MAPALNLPDWSTRAFLLACVVGFPLWVVFGWFYELTPEGFKRDSEIPADAPVRQSSARKLDVAIIGVLVVVVALLASGYFIRATSPVARAAPFNPPADSIVVLPFANLGGDPQQRYFSNGITEELTDALGQNTSLTVIAWNTASKYALSTQSPRQIGRALNVAHVLAGSIQHADNVIRVTSELIDTRNGRQLWSDHYDDSLQNIFAVQDKISAAIAGALKVRLAAMHAAPTMNPQAHELYLKGLAAVEGVTASDAQAAQKYFQRALELDPHYADAWAGLAGSYLALAQWSTLPMADATAKMRAAASKALELDPRNVNALVQLANADNADNHTLKAAAEYKRAVALDPNNARAHLDYGTVLPLAQDLVQTREAARLDPDSATAQNNLATIYQDLSDWPGMVRAAQALNKLSPHGTDAAFYLAFAYAQMRRGADAAKAFDLVHPTDPRDQQLVHAGRLTYRALIDSALRPQALAALAAFRHTDASPYAQGDVLQLYLALGETRTALQMLPAICAAGPVACNDLATNPMYAPLRADPRFGALAKKYTTMTLD